MRPIQNKRIAIVINTAWNIYNFRIGLLRGLQDEGYTMIAIAPYDAYVSKLEALGIEYHEIKMNNKGTNPIEEIRLIWDLYRLYKRLELDAVLHYTIKPNIYGAMASHFLDIPVISNISGLGTVFLEDTFSSKVARFLYKIALGTPQKVFFQNTQDRALFIKSALVKEAKTDVLAGSGINTEQFKPIKYEKKSKEIRFLFIARLLRDKGLVEYIEASKMLQNKGATFLILGAYYPDNPTAITQKEMQTWEEEGIVSYLGVSDDVASYISWVDCVVLPSYREGLSRVLLESASMAKPLVTTDVAGCKEVVDDGINGFLVEVKSSQSLAEGMQKMMDLSEEARAKMGRKGREKVIASFDEKRVIDKYKSALSDIFDK